MDNLWVFLGFLAIVSAGITMIVYGISWLYRNPAEERRNGETVMIKRIIREILHSLSQSSYAEKTCSLNRARNMLNEILEPEQVDAAELLQKVGG